MEIICIIIQDDTIIQDKIILDAAYIPHYRTPFLIYLKRLPPSGVQMTIANSLNYY